MHFASRKDVVSFRSETRLLGSFSKLGDICLCRRDTIFLFFVEESTCLPVYTCIRAHICVYISFASNLIPLVVIFVIFNISLSRARRSRDYAARYIEIIRAVTRALYNISIERARRFYRITFERRKKHSSSFHDKGR